tara:strand:- start:7694 stop:9727 length:2034 start_codon:yes stop_codon:yes gene_type:complete
MKVYLSNISPNSGQKAWNYCAAIPKKFQKDTDTAGKVVLPDGRTFRAATIKDEFFVEADLNPGESVMGEYIESPGASFGPHTITNWIIDEPLKLVPKFVIKSQDGTQSFESMPMPFWDGQGVAPGAYLKADVNSIRARFEVKTYIPEVALHIHGYMDVFTNQDYVPFVFDFNYGDVGHGDWEKNFGSLSMVTGEKPTVDFFKNKGLHVPMYRNDIQAWETELVSPRTWRKSRTIEVMGALLCMPNYALIPQWSTKPDYAPRLKNLNARVEGPICALVDGHQYESALQTPVLPIQGPGHSREITRLVLQMYNRNNSVGDEYSDRPEAQPNNSGRTGAQKDFGATNLYAVLAGNQAWAIWEYRFNAQAWKLRPYGHREITGNPVKAADHPKFHNYDMRPDPRFCQGDMLGWPNPVPYFENWGGSDNQHRSDNLLIDLYRVTKDPSLKRVLDDLVEVQKMELDITTYYPNGPVGSPRGWGRPLMSVCKLYSLGYTDLLPLINKWVDYLYVHASMTNLPKDSTRSVKVLSDAGSKYGWLYPNGTSVRAWICWEESIAGMGLWAAYKATGNIRARELALEIGRTICKHGFFKAKEDGRWYSAYAVRWDADNPGIPMPDTSYNLNPANTDVYVYGMHDWMIPSLRILLKNIDNTDPLWSRTTEILSFFGSTATPEQSNWWSII